MAHYYISSTPVGYVVQKLERDYNVCDGKTKLRNFGFRQSDAMEFRDDCNKGLIDGRRINDFIRTYTDQPYQYLGKGRLKKIHDEL